ncbi:UNVERIFIED_CONTAM: hypothetical protein GTU68_019252 [Idotea baltica]|nr:hypothetical protein [Idotea baltica]
MRLSSPSMLPMSRRSTRSRPSPQRKNVSPRLFLSPKPARLRLNRARRPSLVQVRRSLMISLKFCNAALISGLRSLVTPTAKGPRAATNA